MNPTVCAICLVNGRPELVKRAIRSFREQTYQNAYMLVYDTGSPFLPNLQRENPQVGLQVCHITSNRDVGATVGKLRNRANELVATSEIIVHWDSDDWSHSRRIEEQVALLQASGKVCVGYREMLFWKTGLPEDCICDLDPRGCGIHGDAWLYTNRDTRYCLGTSLTYWRSAWEGRPFPDAPKHGGATGEDTEWLREIDSLGASVLQDSACVGPERIEPRMIASVHGDNTQRYDRVMIEGPNWKRVPEWDAHCREAMR